MNIPLLIFSNRQSLHRVRCKVLKPSCHTDLYLLISDWKELRFDSNIEISSGREYYRDIILEIFSSSSSSSFVFL